MSVPNTPRSTGAGHPRQSRPAASRSRRAPRRHTLLPFALCCVGALALGVILQVAFAQRLCPALRGGG